MKDFHRLKLSTQVVLCTGWTLWISGTKSTNRTHVPLTIFFFFFERCRERRSRRGSKCYVMSKSVWTCLDNRCHQEMSCNESILKSRIKGLGFSSFPLSPSLYVIGGFNVLSLVRRKTKVGETKQVHILPTSLSNCCQFVSRKLG